MDIHVIPADWRSHAQSLRAIRDEVFVKEQKVPQSLEWDGMDDTAHHFLAIASTGARIGCARLLPTGQIGRMAVLKSSRGKGVGRLLLDACIEKAKSLGISRATLHAQMHAAEFYRKAGFLPVGAEFLEAGIPHQEMELVLPIPFEPVAGVEKPEIREQAPDPNSEDNRLRHFEGESACLSGVLEVMDWPRRTLRIYSQQLDHALFDLNEVVDSLSAFARKGPPVRALVLLHSSNPLVSRGHRLLDLARRLDSKIQIRTVPGELATDRHTCLLCDEQGYFLMPDHDEYQAYANRYDPVQTTRLVERFDYLWERSTTDPDLRILRI